MASARENEDRYKCFEQLKVGETRGVHYCLYSESRDVPVAIIAPHGGHIEPHTTLIAEKIAGNRYGFYSFIGLIPHRPHSDLHITSTLFDEPECVKLISSCDIVVAIHGRADNDDPKTVLTGGLDHSLRQAIENELTKAEFRIKLGTGKYAGKEPSNICNRGPIKRGKPGGTQLELPRTLRNGLEKDAAQLVKFASAIVAAIESCR